jgi:hypothetical protein
MIKWTDCPGDGPVITKKVKNMSASERRHLERVARRGHVKNEFEKMRRDDYVRRHRGRHEGHEEIPPAVRSEQADDVSGIKRVDGEWPIRK